MQALGGRKPLGFLETHFAAGKFVKERHHLPSLTMGRSGEFYQHPCPCRDLSYSACTMRRRNGRAALARSLARCGWREDNRPERSAAPDGEMQEADGQPSRESSLSKDVCGLVKWLPMSRAVRAERRGTQEACVACWSHWLDSHPCSAERTLRQRCVPHGTGPVPAARGQIDQDQRQCGRRGRVACHTRIQSSDLSVPNSADGPYFFFSIQLKMNKELSLTVFELNEREMRDRKLQ